MKARFGTKEEYVQAILEGQFDVDSAFRKRLTNGDGVAVRETETAKKLALEIQDTIRQMKLAPMISTSYNRMAFQVPGDPRFRISLDTELRFWREDVSSVPGCGIDEIEDGDIFPYAVLEVKTQTHEGVEQPEWVTELVESSLVRRYFRFDIILNKTKNNPIKGASRSQIFKVWPWCCDPPSGKRVHPPGLAGRDG